MPTIDEYLDREIIDRLKLLPSWFSTRMMTDEWSFGLMLVDGQVLAVRAIDNIVVDAAGNLWIDATLLEEQDHLYCNIERSRIFFAPTSRTKVSINCKQS